MTPEKKPIQLIANSQLTNLIEEIATNNQIETKSSELPDVDQNFGLAEATAIILPIKSAAELAKVIVEIWKTSKGPAKVVIRTPKKELIVNSQSHKSTEDLLEEFKPYFE